MNPTEGSNPVLWLARKGVPIGFFTLLALIYFLTLVLHPTQTLYADHSDLIALHVPWETFLARSWKETGEIPLWNPLQFAGLPFAHDIQAAISYPPHLIFRVIDEHSVGAILSWLIVAHVALSGCGMYVYARSIGLDKLPALVAAMGFMFAGKWLLHLTLAGHYAFIGITWFPWIVYWLRRSLKNSDPLAPLWAGLMLGMLILSTHSQVMMYCAFTLVFYTFSMSKSWDRQQLIPALSRCFLVGIIAVVVAAGIALIQLLPTLEASAFSSRGTRGLPESPTFSIRTLLLMFGPSLVGVQPVISWESKSGTGFIWVAIAILAPMVTTKDLQRRATWNLILLIAMTLFALGGASIFQPLPFFRMFRHPTRVLLVAALPLAELAGLFTQGLFSRTSCLSHTLARHRRIYCYTIVTLLFIVVAGAISISLSNLRFHPYWLTLLITIPSGWWLLGKVSFQSPAKVAWVLILFVDLVAQTWFDVRVCDLNEILKPSLVAQYLKEHVRPTDRVLERHSVGHHSSTPLTPAVATKLGIQCLSGYNPLDLLLYKDYLALVSDNKNVNNPYNSIANAPIIHKTLIDLLGVRFMVQPRDPRLRSVPTESNPDDDPRWCKVTEEQSPLAFTFAAGGLQLLPAYEVLENQTPYPRAFVVADAVPSPAQREDQKRLLLSMDFRRAVLVDDASSSVLSVTSPRSQAPFQPAIISRYQPNEIQLDAFGPGFLVLTDPWYPGWIAKVDGVNRPIFRANYLFRGVPLEEGHHTITFRFRPLSYIIGRYVTMISWILLGLTAVIGIVKRGLGLFAISWRK